MTELECPFKTDRLYIWKSNPEVPMRFVKPSYQGGKWFQFVKANDPDHIIYSEVCKADFYLIEEVI